MISDARERRDRLRRHAIERVRRISQSLGERTPDLEVKLGILLARDVAVHVLDGILEPFGVDEVARVGLRQALRGAHLLGR